MKLKKYLLDGYVNYYGTDRIVEIPDDYKEYDKELRGVWFSTVENIDLPFFESPEDGEKFVEGVIEKCHEYHLNTIVLQIRPTNDALYKSEFNPWTAYFNRERKEDIDPGFDFLGCFIKKAKKYDIDIHAWMNPYRVTNRDLEKMGIDKLGYVNTLSDRNFAKQNPDLVLETKLHHLILDPASVEVQDYLVKTVLEIANKYDVKAFHIDDYFYPYDPIVDEKEEEKHQAIRPDLSLEDFRRYNVDQMIFKIHDALSKLDKKIEFGISPFGVYRTNSKWFEGGVGGWEKGSNNMPGALQSYEAPLYSDVYKWMKEGWIDYVVPQNYFAFENYKVKDDGTLFDIVKYADLVEWWSGIAKETGTKLYIGQAIYRYSEEGLWSNSLEIINQLKYNHTYDNVKGFVMFTYRNFVNEQPKSLVEARELYKKMITKDVKPE